MAERNEVIAERYRLVAPVGRGATGVVWQARDERLGRVVAIKFPTALPTEGDPSQALERIAREGRIAARLRHPHAVTVHDVVEHGGRPCLVMEYLPSRTLAELLDERGPLPGELVAGVGWQVAAALAAAHAAGVVHRDVTPFNVLLGDDGTAKIADFGVARAVGEGAVADTRPVVGTPAFLAPEVVAGQEAVFASDVYSLGATLYAALEGHPPFGTAQEPPPAEEGASPLAQVLRQLLRRDPAQRPTMAEAHGLLDAVVAGRPLPGSPQAGDTRALPAPRRASWRAITLVSGAAVLAVGGLVVGGLVVNGLVAGNSSRGGDPSSEARPAPTDTPSTTTTTATAVSSGCTARFEITNSWPGGYQVQVTVRNAGERALDAWAVTWPQPEGHTISNLWNGVLTANTGTASVTVTSAGYNAELPVAGSTTFGFTANGPATPRLDLTCTSGD
ncbi:protein kinase domain-containing protein [Saccharothrix coeruleofusca]|uniref:non-specific serine/threonine protein kinase n=1 Tax=Saccharothrix coeruleofusca TaxID=33919 RepID=A0A918AR34_9PSEU|nr:protein kinase [Saccharothrix coeruleofusca]MBP2335726.1 serine/threonine protein kinase [Saccharothrix coeruleofusca]GGP75537.1 serine/threonine protein kinase [Saccharothrix coeruleofusca]